MRFFWRNSRGLLDGHHRYSIDPDAPVRVVEGLSEGEKRAFVFRSNFTRRNLSPDQKRAAREGMKRLAKQLREEDAKRWTQQAVAEVLGVSRSCVENWLSSNDKPVKATNDDLDADDDTPTTAPPDARAKLTDEQKNWATDQVDAGRSQAEVASDLGVSQKTVSNAVRSVRAKRAKRAAAEARRSEGTPALPDAKYGLILADPPWRYEHSKTKSRENARAESATCAIGSKSNTPNQWGRDGLGRRDRSARGGAAILRDRDDGPPVGRSWSLPAPADPSAWHLAISGTRYRTVRSMAC